MPPTRPGRRRALEEDADVASPIQTQQRRWHEASVEDQDVDMDGGEHIERGSGSLEQLSKSLIRYALSCEYSRKPIKRQDINEKGTGSIDIT